MRDAPYESDLTVSPQVSIIVPCYNVAGYVPTTLDSALAQEGVTTEIIAVNDGSTDETAHVLDRYADRIRILTQANAGLSGARNAGAKHATGRYLAFLDADDLLFPGALKKLVDAMEASGCGVAYGEAVAIDGDGKILTGKPMGYRSPGANTMRALCAGTLFQPSAGLVRREVFDRVDGFDQSLKSVEDLDFQYRCAAHTEFSKIDDPVLYYRINPTSLTRNYPRMIEQALKVHSTNARRFGLLRRYPREILAGRLKAGFYFCSEHLGSRGKRPPELTAAARKSFLHHPWLLLMLGAMPGLKKIKKAAVSGRLADQTADNNPAT